MGDDDSTWHTWPPGQAADVLARAVVVAEAGGTADPGAVSDSVRREVARIWDLEAGDLSRRLDRVLCGEDVGGGLELLRASGILAVLLPEVEALVDFHASCAVHHKDLWAHTVEVVERTRADADLRWAALLHDVGKVPTRHLDERRRVSFLRHERVGAIYARGVGARLGMPEARIGRIAFVIEHHARVNAYEPGWSDRAVRRLVRDAGPRLDDLLAFSGADYTTRRRDKASRIRAQLRHLTERIERLRREDEAADLLPRGMGRVVCEALDIPPGPAVGEHLAWLRDRIREGDLPAHADPDTYAEALKAHRRG